MAHSSSSNLNLDALNRSQSNLSVISNEITESNRSGTSTTLSTTSSQKRSGIFSKIGTGVQTIFRRFSRSHTSLTEMEIHILLAMTHYTREEILQWHEKFLSVCPHGHMSRKQFTSMHKISCPKGDAERFTRHVFRAFDVDKSNSVDFREFLVGLSMTSPASSIRTKLEWTFHVFDIDGNGLLTRRECLEVIETIVRFNQSSQGDSQTSNLEQSINSAKRSMMRIFDNVSDSHTDKLTMLQFVESCQKDQLISKLLAPGTTLQNTSDTSSTNS